MFSVEALLDLAGIFVFATSGALVAVRKRLDIVGMAVLAEITALGGGILRDLVIGAVPPKAFESLGYLLVPLGATIIVFFWHPQVAKVHRTMLIFDAAGVGLFAATGTAKALTYELPPVHAAVLGVCTAVGGGILRDVLARKTPAVLADRELYALPALAGAAAVAAANYLEIDGPVVLTAAATLTFVLRLAAMRFRWRAPRARGIS